MYIHPFSPKHTPAGGYFIWRYPCTALLTPSFQPMRGMMPITHIVLQHILTVANRPINMFCVAIVRMGNARRIPTTIPNTALSAIVCKYDKTEKNIH